MRIPVASAALLLALVMAIGPGAAAAHEPTVTEFQVGLSLSNGAWDIVGPRRQALVHRGHPERVWADHRRRRPDQVHRPAHGRRRSQGHHKGPDGNLWIAEAGLGGAIARVTNEGAVTEFSAGLTAGDPWDITVGADGNLWFVSQAPAFIGRVTLDGTITEFSAGLTPNSQPSAIAAGPDGNLWFTESADPGRIGRITTDGVITENSIGLTPNMIPTDITAGPDGNLWFTENGTPGAIGRITPEGQITEFRDGLTSGSGPMGIAAGTDGALWFTEAASPGRIGRITKHGDISEYVDGLTPDRSPWFITPGPDGNMWFTENANPGLIARISLPPTVRGRSVAEVGPTSARLPAKVRANAQATEYHFEYGPTEAYAKQTDSASAGSGWEAVEVSARVAGLRPSTKYHYRVVATNDSGTTTGAEGSFKTAALEPDFGDMVVAAARGRVRFKRPGGRWQALPDWGAELPVGVALDTRRGTISLTSAGRRGGTQTGTFGGGVLQVRQPRSAHGRVDLHLRGGSFAACRHGSPARRSTPGRAALAARPRRVRRLWARDRGGRFRTYGRNSHATVRGTRWLTEDRCDGTLTRVTQGAVVVRAKARHRTVVVRAGHSYLARRPRR